MNKENLRLDYFIDPSIPIYQHPSHFRFNTDTKLLAQFMKIRKGDRVLDIGTNNGALLLYADQFDVKELIGVEVLQDSSEIAKYNASCFIKHPCTIIHAPIQSVEVNLVDVIISNPPFFTEKETHPNTIMDMRQLGRVEVHCDLDDLCKHANRLLKSHGRFYFVHRPDRIHEIAMALAKYNFSMKTLQFAYDPRNDAVKSVLIEAVKEANGRCQVLPMVVL